MFSLEIGVGGAEDFGTATLVQRYTGRNPDPKIGDSRIARLRLLRGPFLTTRLGKGLSTASDTLKRKSVLSLPGGSKGFLRGSRKWMIRLGGKSKNLLVSQVKVLKQRCRLQLFHALMPVILSCALQPLQPILT